MVEQFWSTTINISEIGDSVDTTQQNHITTGNGVRVDLPRPDYKNSVSIWRDPRTPKKVRDEALERSAALVTRVMPDGTVHSEVYYPIDAVEPLPPELVRAAVQQPVRRTAEMPVASPPRQPGGRSASILRERVAPARASAESIRLPQQPVTRRQMHEAINTLPYYGGGEKRRAITDQLVAMFHTPGVRFAPNELASMYILHGALRDDYQSAERDDALAALETVIQGISYDQDSSPAARRRQFAEEPEQPSAEQARRRGRSRERPVRESGRPSSRPGHGRIRRLVSGTRRVLSRSSR